MHQICDTSCIHEKEKEKGKAEGQDYVFLMRSERTQFQFWIKSLHLFFIQKAIA